MANPRSPNPRKLDIPGNQNMESSEFPTSKEGKRKKTPSKAKCDHLIFTGQEIRPNVYTATPSI